MRLCVPVVTEEEAVFALDDTRHSRVVVFQARQTSDNTMNFLAQARIIEELTEVLDPLTPPVILNIILGYEGQPCRVVGFKL